MKRREETRIGRLPRSQLASGSEACRGRCPLGRRCNLRRRNSIAEMRLRPRSLEFLPSSLRVYSLGVMREVVSREPLGRIRMTELATFAGVEWSECEGFCNSNNNYEFISAFCLRSRGWRGILRKAPPMRVSAFPRPPQFFIPRLTDTDSAAGSHIAGIV